MTFITLLEVLRTLRIHFHDFERFELFTFYFFLFNLISPTLNEHCYYLCVWVWLRDSVTTTLVIACRAVETEAHKSMKLAKARSKGWSLSRVSGDISLASRLEARRFFFLSFSPNSFPRHRHDCCSLIANVDSSCCKDLARVLALALEAASLISLSKMPEDGIFFFVLLYQPTL